MFLGSSSRGELMTPFVSGGSGVEGNLTSWKSGSDITSVAHFETRKGKGRAEC